MNLSPLVVRTTVALALALSATAAMATDAAVPAKGLQPLTVEEATADVLSWGLNLSPSGRYLAALRRKDLNMDLVVVADLENENAPPFAFPVGDGHVQWVDWVSDDRLLFAVELWVDAYGHLVPPGDVVRRGAFTVQRLFAIDRDGKNLVLLFAGNKAAQLATDLTRVTAFLPKDPRHIIMPAWASDELDLFKVDVYTGKSERIAEGSGRTLLWFTDRDGQPAFRVDRNLFSTAAYIYGRKGPMPADPDDLQWEKLYTISLRREDYKGAPDFYPLYPGPDLTTYYVTARPEGADTNGIYLYDFAARKFIKTLATEPGVDIDTVIVDPETREYLGVHYYTDRRVTRINDSRLQAHFDALDKYFGGEVDVYLVDYSDDHSVWLLYTLGPRDRGSWHVYRLKDKYVREVAHLQPVIAPERLGTSRVVRYKARDGLEIMGYLTVPPGQPADAKPPLIMLPHGGPEARDDYGFDLLVQMLASRGYQVFQPNFRGSSGFGKKFADAGKHQWGRAMQDDLTDAFEFLVKNGYADRDRACILGGSYGGYAALAAATLTPDLYRCAVSIAGISDLPEQLKFDKHRDDDEVWDYVRRQIGDPKADKAMLEQNSPDRLAGAVKIPVLLLHGDQDTRVPIEQSEMMDKALRKAGKDVRFVRLKDIGHSLGDEGVKLLCPPLLEFLEQHLPVTRQSSPSASATTSGSPRDTTAPGT